MPTLIRRQRLLTFCAIVIVFMLYRVVQNSWDESATYADLRSGYHKPPGAGQPPPPEDYYHAAGDAAVVPPVERPQQQVPIQEDEKTDSGYEEEADLGVKIPELNDQASYEAEESPADSSRETTGDSDTEGDDGNDESMEVLDDDDDDDNDDDVDALTRTTEDELDIEWEEPPNDESNKAIQDEPKIHWKKSPEHFPVPEESIIPLPTGKPQEIPQIQFNFKEESEEDRARRIQRQQRVKTEIDRSWAAYRKFAWMRDELAPVSGKWRDKFCSWGATLVDSLDTLWIAGLKDQFDEAAKAVADIDFTYTPRQDIPVFETTIRYLGGLLGAYDVSGGPEGDYKILLDKAVELAEILMGIFDTPNRMPLLYYNWRPAYVSQPHRAGRVGVAELATLSLEFTRLAQLTGEDKYYDAIDRITNGLVEFQEAGSNIPGLFPEGLDVSGCNKTATTIRDNLSTAAKEQLDSQDTLEEPQGYVPQNKPSKGGAESQGMVRDDDRVLKRGVDQTGANVDELERRAATEGQSANPPPFAADGSTSEWDCVAQGIVPSGTGYQSFHMGGAQDSAYEYFPKEYLLLGGHEPKYQKLYEDTVDAVKKWLLFRPMAPDDWNVLFPRKISTNNRVNGDLSPQYEISHLTCFIGGMYGLGGKIFGREEDVELAKELTDGCVWAYQLMPSGLMPEAAHVIPCPDLEKCEFNETLWHERLDPSRQWRDSEIAKWEEAEAAEAAKETEAEKEASRLSEAAGVEDVPGSGQEKYDAEKAAEAEQLKQSATDSDDASESVRDSLRKRAAIPVKGEDPDDDDGSQLPDELKEKLGMANEKEDEKTEPSTSDDKPVPDEETEGSADEPSKTVPTYIAPERMAPKRQKPLSHDEFVQKRIKDDGLPPGFTDIDYPNYILR
jgi:mannosyl-oligosaccharide alpha-1,2-mannosidase